MLTARRRVSFDTWEAKATELQRLAESDARHPTILTMGRRIAAAFPYPPARAQAIHAFVRDRIRYQSDRGGVPGREELAHSAVILARGFDDCDGKARLFVALCLASGLDAQIVPVAPAGLFVHVQAAVRLSGRWHLAELTLRGVPLGAGVEAAELDASGLPIYS